MVSGLAMFSWDRKEGSILETKFPETLELNETLINQVYMTHSYDQDFEKEELIETNYNEHIIISYCDKSRVKLVGYEIILLITHARDSVRIHKLKAQLTEFAKKTYAIPNEQRNQYFQENANIFFKKTSPRKILVLGRAGTGKTTIRKIIFEGMSPETLLINPLEPTRGISPSVYSWLDLNLGVFDSSGQELGALLKDEDEHNAAFENTDVIIYVVDFPEWSSKFVEVMDEIGVIKQILSKNSFDTKLIVFFHKIDLINVASREEEFKDIENIITSKLSIPIYFTSIYPNLIYLTYNAFYEILSSFSDEAFALKLLLDEAIQELSQVMCFISNKNSSIIAQTMSKDFNINLINQSHKIITQLNETFEELVVNDNIEHLILSSAKQVNVIMISLNFLKNNLKSLILISDALTANKLIWVMGEIKTELTRYFYVKTK